MPPEGESHGSRKHHRLANIVLTADIPCPLRSTSGQKKDKKKEKSCLDVLCYGLCELLSVPYYLAKVVGRPADKPTVVHAPGPLSDERAIHW